MSNKEENQKNNEVKYFSTAHVETGFLNSLTLVESKKGDYYAIKFAARRGSSEEPLTAAHSVRINGVQAKEVIAKVSEKVSTQLAANKKLWDAKRGKETVAILITLNISDTVAKCYTNKHTGKESNYIDGRCTSIAYVRIGNEVIFQKDGEKVEAAKETPVVDAQTPVVDAQGLPSEVVLDMDAKNFQARKAELKSQGYTWNSDKKVWSL